MDPIRVMIIGAGSWRGAWFAGEYHHHPHFQLAALVDTMPQVAQAVANFLGLRDIPIYADALETLDAVECDAVLVIVPDFLHTTFTVEALKRGKFVYVEKPMSVSLEDCLAIVRADRAAGGKTMIGHNMRYVPVYARVRQLIRQGLIGDLLTIQADEFYYNGRTFFRRWNRLRRFSGGLWVTKVCHDFDMHYWLSSALPQTVSASASLSHYTPKPEAAARCRDCRIEASCPDSHLRFTSIEGYHDYPPLRRVIEEAREANGAPADLCLFNSEKDTFDNGMSLVTYENGVKAGMTFNIVAPFTDRRIRVSGTDGTLDGSFESPEILYWKRHDGEALDRAARIPINEEGVITQGLHGGADNFLLNTFLGFIRGDKTCAPGPAEAAVAIATGCAATLAADTGATVRMDDLAGWGELKGYLAETAAR